MSFSLCLNRRIAWFMGLERKVGVIAPGKLADIVIWNVSIRRIPRFEVLALELGASDSRAGPYSYSTLRTEVVRALPAISRLLRALGWS